MRGFRAKDADRDRYVEVIEAAYVDGQISDADRDLRVSRALSAGTLDELVELTRDLQNRPVPVEAATSVTRAPRTPASSAAVARLVAVAVAVVALLAGGLVGLFALSSTGSGSSTGADTTVVVSSEAVPVPSATTAAAPSFEMTAARVRAFLRAYEQEFGTLDAWEAGFYPDRVGVQVPVRGSRPRSERWSWDGEWRQDTEASAVRGPSGMVDLGAIDVRLLFANIAKARRTLDVPGAELTHVLVNDWGEGPGLNVYVSNEFGEDGYLRTTPSGDVVRAVPYGS